MAQPEKAFATKPDNLSLTLRTHMSEEEKKYTYCGIYPYRYTGINIQIYRFIDLFMCQINKQNVKTATTTDGVEGFKCHF